MDKYSYGKVNTTEDNVEEKERSWIPFIRQFFVCCGPFIIYFTVGVCYGAPTIYIQQLRNEANSTEAVSVNMASWLSSAFGYASLPWVLILTAISHTYGRRKTFLLVSLGTIIMFICFSLSTTTTHLLISTILQGIPNASALTVSLLIIAEYTSPAYRGVLLTMKTVSLYWGIWFSNAIGAFSHWSYIPRFGLFCSLFSLTAFVWPESPYWLASKGRYEECKESHRWLKGRGVRAEKELEKLVSGQLDVLKFCTFKQMKSKHFYMPIIISCVLAVQYYACGKLICSIYAIDILKKMTSNTTSAYRAMLILDGFTVFSMYGGCILNRYVNRRRQLFTFASIGLVFLFALSLYLYLIKLEVTEENNVLTLVLLIAFSVAMSSGPAIMGPSTFGEIIPMKFKNVCIVLISVWFLVLSSSTLKAFPYIHLAFGLHGTFLFYGICMLIVTLILYKILPETKDKTLKEIEESFKQTEF